MKTSKTLQRVLLIFSIILAPFAIANPPLPSPVYQLTSQHPEDLAFILPRVQTVYRENRLWLVTPKNPADLPLLRDHLRPAQGLNLRTYSTHFNGPALKADPRILQVNQEFDIRRVTDDVKWLSSFKNRSAGSPENQQAQVQMAERLAKFGYQMSTVCYSTKSCSVLAEKAPTPFAQKSGVILVVAHFDSVGKDFAGADDNGSGTAVALEIARVLASRAVPRTVRFLLANGEENGLLGSVYYVKQLEKAGKLKEIGLVINMDMVGYNKNGTVELETDAPFENVAKQFALLVSTYTSLKSKITLGAWGSDHVPFLRRNVPALLTIEDWSTKTPCYHQRCDTPDTINFSYAHEIGKLNLAAILTYALL